MTEPQYGAPSLKRPRMSSTVMHTHMLNLSVPGTDLAGMGRQKAGLFMQTTEGSETTTNSSRKVKSPLPRLTFPARTDVGSGVDFTGAIVLVRYGWVFRGLKVSNLGAYRYPIHHPPLSLAHRSKAHRNSERLAFLCILTPRMTAL